MDREPVPQLGPSDRHLPSHRPSHFSPSFPILPWSPAPSLHLVRPPLPFVPTASKRFATPSLPRVFIESGRPSGRGGPPAGQLGMLASILALGSVGCARLPRPCSSPSFFESVRRSAQVGARAQRTHGRPSARRAPRPATSQQWAGVGAQQYLGTVRCLHWYEQINCCFLLSVACGMS